MRRPRRSRLCAREGPDGPAAVEAQRAPVPARRGDRMARPRVPTRGRVGKRQVDDGLGAPSSRFRVSQRRTRTRRPRRDERPAVSACALPQARAAAALCASGPRAPSRPQDSCSDGRTAEPDECGTAPARGGAPRDISPRTRGPAAARHWPGGSERASVRHGAQPFGACRPRARRRRAHRGAGAVLHCRHDRAHGHLCS